MKSKTGFPTLFLIGGQGRSGTTMLQEVCADHPQISISHESKAFVKTGYDFPVYFRALRKPSHPLGIFSKNKLVNHIYFWRLVIKLIASNYRNVTIADVHKAYHSLFPGAALVGDKYPNYLWQLKELTTYEGIRIVIIYRDGRDVAQSIYARVLTDWKDKKWAKKKYNSFTNIAIRWVQAIEVMEEYADQIHIIRYEEFVTHPEVELARLADYLSIDPAGFQPSMISSRSIGKFKEMLTKQQLGEFLAVAGPMLKRLGYT